MTQATLSSWFCLLHYYYWPSSCRWSILLVVSLLNIPSEFFDGRDHDFTCVFPEPAIRQEHLTKYSLIFFLKCRPLYPIIALLNCLDQHRALWGPWCLTQSWHCLGLTRPLHTACWSFLCRNSTYCSTLLPRFEMRWWRWRETRRYIDFRHLCFCFLLGAFSSLNPSF